MSGHRKQWGIPVKERVDPRFQLKYPDMKTFDQLRLRSGTTIQREMSEWDRCKLIRDQRKSRSVSLSPRRVTSSLDTMDTDDARNHTRKIFKRMRSQSISPVGRGPIKAFPLKLAQVEEEEGSDDTRADAESNKTVIEREAIPEGPLLLKEVATNSKTSKLTTRLTYGISDSLDLGKEGSDIQAQSPVVKIEPLPEFTHRDLYLPIPGCPSLNQLEPVELENLTPRGNHAKMVKILTLQPKYRAEYYVVDGITGEMYAHTAEGLVAIKEQAYLDWTVALEATAAEFPEVTSASASPPSTPKLSTDQTKREGALDHSEKDEEVQQKKIELTSKEASDQTILAESLIDSNYLQRKEEALLLHKRAMQEYLAMRSQCKQGSQLASCRAVFCAGFHVVTSTTHGVHMDITWHPCGNPVVSCRNHIVSTFETPCCPPGHHIVSTWKPNGVHLETTWCAHGTT